MALICFVIFQKCVDVIHHNYDNNRYTTAPYQGFTPSHLLHFIADHTERSQLMREGCSYVTCPPIG